MHRPIFLAVGRRHLIDGLRSNPSAGSLPAASMKSGLAGKT
jgi:hypothetical protein